MLPSCRLETRNGLRPTIEPADRISLRLMGIGNPVLQEHPDRSALITPHGDRKPVTMGRSAGDVAWDSLPLMGIGNSGSFRRSCWGALICSLPLMGIGNLDVPGLGIVGQLQCSLPLMGIGNARAELGAMGHGGLITPHGDRKLQGGSLHRRSAPDPHYPSWGSETVRLHHLAERPVQLITPHGDRKLQVARPRASVDRLITPHGDRKPPKRNRCRCRPVAPPLITPHGDRKPEDSAVRVRHDDTLRDSLPLMGIGNMPVASLVVSRGGASLPLMGIGNRGVVALPDDGSRDTAHYPSWGSETRRHRATARTTRRAHYPSWGSETWTPSDHAADWTCSLPLMGIGNPQPFLGGARRKLGAHSLPLMGIGNLRRGRFSTALHEPHYPSWGSETWRPAPASALSARNRGLITPHGDRKLAASRRTPSWSASYSLPLMGIGNLARTNADTDNPATLITPHGDRKLLWDRRVLRVAQHLITPHGDRKLGAFSGQETPPRTHYPSWGSETRRRRRVEPRVQRLITPHGDRKLVDQPAGELGGLDLITPHGDRKLGGKVAGPGVAYTPHYPSWGSETPARGSRRAHPRRSHYPSWGSETFHWSSLVLSSHSISLPLMGIGNLAIPGSDPGACSSLPLMGSETYLNRTDGPLRSALEQAKIGSARRPAPVDTDCAPDPRRGVGFRPRRNQHTHSTDQFLPYQASSA